MTQPVLVDTNVTEEAWKFGGTGGNVGMGVGVEEAALGPPVAVWAGFGEVRCTGAEERDTATGVPSARPFTISLGTAIAPATTMTAPTVAIAAWPSFRRRARLVICSKAPGRGSKGVTRS
jgi:hypothetical protein